MAQIEMLLVEDVDFYRHWHSGSEKYTGGDSLATLLAHGWQMRSLVFEDIFYCSGSRPVHIYHFELVRGDESASMSVLVNPFVSRLVQSRGMRVVQVDRGRAPRVALSRFLKRAALEAHESTELETSEAEKVVIPR